MKKIFLLLFGVNIIFGFYSCSTVAFETPAPDEKDNTTYFPKDWVGSYINNDDTIVIGENYFILSILGKKEKIDLNDTVFLRKLNNEYWCLNIGEENKDKWYWLVIPIKEKGNKLQIYTIEFGQKIIDELNKLNISYKLIDKTNLLIRQSDSATITRLIDNGVFSKYNTMKKIIK